MGGPPSSGDVLKFFPANQTNSNRDELRWGSDLDSGIWTENAAGTEASYNGTVEVGGALFFGNGNSRTVAGLAYNGTNLLALGHSGGAVRLGIDPQQQFAAFYPSADATFDLGTANSRWLNIWSTNAQIQTSDARLKTAIAVLPYGLRTVLQLKPVTYRWKQEQRDAPAQLGFLAQDVEGVIPEAVVAPPEGQENTDSDVYGMRYQTLIPVLVKAVQEQQALIDELHQRIEQLEAER